MGLRTDGKALKPSWFSGTAVGPAPRPSPKLFDVSYSSPLLTVEGHPEKFPNFTNIFQPSVVSRQSWLRYSRLAGDNRPARRSWRAET